LRDEALEYEQLRDIAPDGRAADDGRNDATSAALCLW